MNCVILPPFFAIFHLYHLFFYSIYFSAISTIISAYFFFFIAISFWYTGFISFCFNFFCIVFFQILFFLWFVEIFNFFFVLFPIIFIFFLRRIDIHWIIKLIFGEIIIICLCQFYISYKLINNLPFSLSFQFMLYVQYIYCGILIQFLIYDEP